MNSIINWLVKVGAIVALIGGIILLVKGLVIAVALLN